MSLFNDLMPHVPPLVREVNKSWEERWAEKEAQWQKEIDIFLKRKKVNKKNKKGDTASGNNKS